MSEDLTPTEQFALVLLRQSAFEEGDRLRSWKGYDWDIMNRLHEMGFITNPVGKVKSVYLTESGEQHADALVATMLGVRTPQASTKGSGGLMILVAGPYRSGTGDDPEKMAANVRAMEAFALPLFRAGHIPVVGEWFALPLVHLAGSQQVGDEAFNEVFHPIAERLLERCDAVLRVGGASQGADLMVRVGAEHGLKIFHRLSDIPGCEG